MARKPKRCAYCGKEGATERDHVPAKCFFPEPRPNIMITVPVCSECNRQEWYGSTEKIEKDEEYTRNIFVWEYNASRHPAAKKLLKPPVVVDHRGMGYGGGAASRSISNDPRVNAIFRDGFRHHQELRTRDGIVIPVERMTLKYDGDRIDRVIRKIIRGLYYHETKQQFPIDYEINIRIISLLPFFDEHRANTPAIGALIAEALTPGNPRRLGDGVFSYAYRNHPPDDPAKTLWAMSFYDGIFIAAATFAPG